MIQYFFSIHIEGISALPLKMSVLHSYNLLRVLGQQDGLDPRSLRSDHEDFLISDIYEICGLMLWWTFDVFYSFYIKLPRTQDVQHWDMPQNSVQFGICSLGIEVSFKTISSVHLLRSLM